MARTQQCYELAVSLDILNGGTGAPATIKPAAVSAAQYAGITSPPWPELVDSLNRKAGNTQPNYRELDAVCNQLAGTKDLTAQDALSRLAGN